MTHPLISHARVSRVHLLAVAVVLVWRMARAAATMVATCFRSQPCDGDVCHLSYKCTIDFSGATKGRWPRIKDPS